MRHPVSGTLDYTATSPESRAPRTGDERVVQRPWRIELDPSGFWKRGTVFGKTDVAGTLLVGGWPVGLWFRDLADTMDWWQVVEVQGRQYLTSLDRTRMLKATSATNLRIER